MDTLLNENKIIKALRLSGIFLNEKLPYYMAKDMNGDTYLYADKPTKNIEKGVWESTNEKMCFIPYTYSFSFSISWNDEFPKVIDEK